MHSRPHRLPFGVSDCKSDETQLEDSMPKHLGLLIAMMTCLLMTSAVRADDPPASQPAASDDSAIVDVSDKSALDAAMGKDAVVEGVVESAAWSSSGKVMQIRFANSKETKFSAAVFEKRKADFDAAFSGDVTKALPGAKVRIRGSIKDFKGRPEIVIDSPAQITIVEPPPSTQPGK
jgi:hypothetical protein